MSLIDRLPGGIPGNVVSMGAEGWFQVQDGGQDAMKETLTRAARDRRVMAAMTWAGLIIASFNLWNSRMIGAIRVTTPEPVAFILAAFSAFVGVFAWMLYNPGRRSAAESPGLFLAAGATLFPPPVIAYCLMPADSPLRWWLTMGIFFLCVIAILSHVPDEFFAVPRRRSSYLTPVPTFDRLEGNHLMDPNAEWFAFSDLSRVVAGGDRPSLAPRAYLQQQIRSAPAPTSTHSPLIPVSDIDDILGSDFDEDFFADDLIGPNPGPSANRASANAFRSPASQAKKAPAVDEDVESDWRPQAQTAKQAPAHPTAHPLPVGPATLPDTPPAYSPWNRSSQRVNRTGSVHREQTTAPEVTVPTRSLPERDLPAPAIETSPSTSVQGNDRRSYRRKDRGSKRRLSGGETAETAPQTTSSTQSSTPSSKAPARQVMPLAAAAAGAAATSSVATSDTPPATGRRNLPDVDRIREEDGSELVEGVMKIRFAEGQKRANLHVPFAPPLPGMPNVECECVDGENLRLKVPVRQSYGIRIEARRSDASHPLEADIRFAAAYTAE